MAELNARIKPKKSSAAGEVPQASDLEVAELAVNTADGKLFVKHTDNSIKEISGGGGGGGAVDSVNGQVGVVSLGLEDLDNVSDGAITWDVVTGSNNSGGMISGAAYTNTQLRVHPVSKEGDQKTSLRAWIATLTFPTTLNLRFDSTAVAYECTGISDLMDGSGSFLPRLDIDGSGLVADGYVGTDLTIAEYNAFIGGASDGQVLTWVAANNQWEPADVAAGGGGVDSVNGETGVVSLGVQDMNDVSTTVPGYAYLGVWDTNLETQFPNQYGDWRIYTANSPDVLQFYKENSAQEDKSADFLALASGDTLEYSTDELTWTAITLVDDPQFSSGGGGNTVLSLDISDADGAPIDALDSSADLYIRIPVTDLSNLADGKVLTWVEASGKWEPVLPSNGAVDSVNGQTGDVSLGVGDLDDAASYSGNYGVWDTYRGEANPGGWDLEGGQYFYLNKVDSNGKDWSDEWGDAPSSGTMFVRNTDDEEWIEVAYSYKGQGGNTLQINTIHLSGSGVTIGYAPMQFAFAALFSATPEDGEVLTWDGGSQKWRPAPSTGTVDSVNGQTGVVVLGVNDLDDAVSYSGDYGVWNTYKGEANPGGWDLEGGQYFYLNKVDSNGKDWSTIWDAVPSSSGTMFVRNLDTDDWKEVSYSYKGGGSNTMQINTIHLLGSGVTIGYAPMQFAFAALFSLTPEDGEVLTWVDANNRWEPVPAGGVESVNGQTGTVSLGVQDMNDFELNQVLTPANQRGVWNEEWPVWVDGTTEFPELPGRWSSFDFLNSDGSAPELAGRTFLFVASTDSEGTAVDVADLLADPTSYGITLVVDGVVQPPVQLVAASTQANGDRYRFDWLTADLSAYTYGESYADGDPIASPGPYSNTLELYVYLWSSRTETPLIEGDILQWSEGAQKFRPTQLPTSGGGAVDSVNGQTGVVSLDIGSLDDVETGVVSDGWRASWTVWTTNQNSPALNSGEMGPATTDETNFNILDNLGNDRSSDLSALNGSTLYWRKNSGAWQSETMTSYRAYQTSTLIPQAAALSASVNAAQVGDTYELTNNPGLDYTPTDGQVLTWVAANDQWQPADYISKATLKAEVAASTDFADFQSRIAAL